MTFSELLNGQIDLLSLLAILVPSILYESPVLVSLVARLFSLGASAHRSAPVLANGASFEILIDPLVAAVWVPEFRYRRRRGESRLAPRVVQSRRLAKLSFATLRRRTRHPHRTQAGSPW
jgi:hypothetical protein